MATVIGQGRNPIVAAAFAGLRKADRAAKKTPAPPAVLAKAATGRQALARAERKAAPKAAKKKAGPKKKARGAA